MKKKTVRAAVAAIVLFGLLAVCGYPICREWKVLEGFSWQTGLRYEHGALSAEQIDTFQKQGQSVELTAWKREENQTISGVRAHWPGQSQTAAVLTIYGPMELVIPGPVKYGGYTFQKDEEGCVISAGLARELFGTDRAVGNVVRKGSRELVVRGVLDLEEPVLACFQTDREESMPWVEIRARDQTPAAWPEQIAAGLGLFGEAYRFQGRFWRSVARLLISLPFWAVIFALGHRFLGGCRQRGTPGRLLFGRILMLLGTALGIYCSISLPPDFLPSRWSDFGFWGRKLQELAEWMRIRRNFPKIYWEGEVLRCVGSIGGRVLMVLAGLALGERLFKNVCRCENP